MATSARISDELDAPAQPPPVPKVTRLYPHQLIAPRKSGVGRAVLIGVLVVAGFLIVLGFLGSLISTDDATVTEQYARRINAFAEKHDMTVEEVIRWDYVLSKRGLTLADFDQALTKLAQSRDRALGYHIEPQRKNLNSRRLVAGDMSFPQNPTLTQDEENAVKLLKLAGY